MGLGVGLAFGGGLAKALREHTVYGEDDRSHFNNTVESSPWVIGMGVRLRYEGLLEKACT